jgi:hypothetical protein
MLVGPSAAHAESSQPSSAPPVTASKLFVQDARSATAERKRGKRWKITLTGVNATTLWFADRPERDAGRQSTRSFVRQWADFGFAADPPNAFIQQSDSDGVAVELRNPRYNRKAATLTYTAIIDPGSGQRLDRKMRQVSVFIDDSEEPSGQVYSLSLAITGVAPGSSFTVFLTEPSGEPDPVYASFGLGDSDPLGPILSIENPGPGVAFNLLQVLANEIRFIPSDQGPDVTIPVVISVPVLTGPAVTAIALSYQSDTPGIQITGAVNNGSAQVLGTLGDRTIFDLTQ